MTLDGCKYNKLGDRLQLTTLECHIFSRVENHRDIVKVLEVMLCRRERPPLFTQAYGWCCLEVWPHTRKSTNTTLRVDWRISSLHRRITLCHLRFRRQATRSQEVTAQFFLEHRVVAQDHKPKNLSAKALMAPLRYRSGGAVGVECQRVGFAMVEHQRRPPLRLTARGSPGGGACVTICNVDSFHFQKT